jgi:hypothetical protein
MREANDWRLTNQLAYLKGATLRRSAYRAYGDSWEHDHCEFCWAKFAEAGAPESLEEGYTTQNEYHWICSTCFVDFEDLFEWKVVG